MKKALLILLATALFSLSFGQNNPVLITIDGEEIRKDEFLYNYTKNNSDIKFDKSSLDEYTDMFIKFKLKVADAKSMGLDTMPKLRKELKGYIDKSAEKYLKDSAASEEIKLEAYERKKYQVRASHILFTGADAYDQAVKVRKELQNNGDFGSAAIKYSQDPSAKENKGDLGYFSVFQMVYPFEEAAYNTKVGEISMPVKTKFGYHLVKVMDKRLNPGRVRVAHIYTKIPKGGDAKTIANAKTKSQEIYQLLKNGEKSFEDLAKEYSEDNTSAQKGGELQWFSTGRMVPEFEKVAFSLKNNGDYSEPFKTSYGWHIVKRLEHDPIGDYAKNKAIIESNLQRGDRSNKSKEYFVSKLMDEYKYKDKSKGWIKKSYTIETLGRLKADDSKTAFTFKKEKGCFKKKTKVTVGEFREYLKINLPESQQDIESNYKKFVTDYFFNFEKFQLPIKYPEYKALMQEFEDGILLFEVSDKKVWSKSSEDSTGLKKFFEDNNDNYVWGKRAKCEVYYSGKMEIINEAMGMAKDSNLILSQIKNRLNQKSQLNLTAYSGTFELGSNKVLKNFNINKTGVTELKMIDGKFYFIKVIEILEPTNKKLEEMRGRAISDYQKYLEAEWIKHLYSTYKVDINKEEIYNLNK